MFAKRICGLLVALCCCALLCSPALASDSGQEEPVLAPQVDCDSVYCFTGEEFGENLTGVCILQLPDSAAGTVLLGTRVVRRGDILAADQLAMLTFQPLRTQVDTQPQVTYLPIYENRVDRSATMTIGIRGKEDKAPVAEDSALETYKNLEIKGNLKVSDPEGQRPIHIPGRYGGYCGDQLPWRRAFDEKNSGNSTHTWRQNGRTR